MTWVGTIHLAIPKLRHGSYFPDWLLDPLSAGGEGTRRGRRRVLRARGQHPSCGRSVKTLGIESWSKSQVSRMAVELDDMVAEFRNRPLDNGPYTYVWMDVPTQKVREGGRIINVAVVTATGVNAEGTARSSVSM